MKKILLSLTMALLFAGIALKAQSGSPRIIGNPPEIVIDSGGETTMKAGGVWKVSLTVKVNSLNGFKRSYSVSAGTCVHQIEKGKEILSWDTKDLPAGKYKVTYSATNEYGTHTYTWRITLT